MPDPQQLIRSVPRAIIPATEFCQINLGGRKPDLAEHFSIDVRMPDSSIAHHHPANDEMSSDDLLSPNHSCRASTRRRRNVDGAGR